MISKKQEPEKIEFKDKIKSSYYLEKKTEERLVEIYIKRLNASQRQRKSHLIDEAVALLHKKEFGS
jgi:hypothetical protein